MVIVKGRASETIKNDLESVCVCVYVHQCVYGFRIKSVARGYEIDATSMHEVKAKLLQR